MNHPFVDGNKRMGLLLAAAILKDGGYKIVASVDEEYDFVVKVATGETRFEEAVAWLRNNSSQA